MKAAINGNITITCQPEGAPQPTITWFKNSSPLTPDGNHVIQLPNGNLVIQGMRQGDVGRYTCKAENEFGVDQSSTSLSIACKYL